MADTTNRIQYILEAAQAQAQAKALDQSLDKIGVSAKSGAATATAALNSTAAPLTAQQTQVQQNQRAIGVYSTEVALARAELAQLNQRIIESTVNSGRNSIATMELRAQYAQLSATTRTLSAEKAIVAAETKELTAAQATNAGATVETAAVTEIAAAKQISLSQAVRVGAAEMRLLGIQGSNMGRSLSVLAGGFSAASGGMLVAILAAGFLIGKFIELVRAKRELIDINEEGLKADAALANADERRIRVTNDISQLLLHLRDVNVELTKHKTEEAKATTELIALGNAENEIRARGVERTLQATLTAKAFGLTQDAFSHSQQEANAAITKNETDLHKTIDTLIRFAAENNRTKDSVMSAARALGIYGDDLATLERQLDAGAIAAARFNLQLSDLRMPKFDITRTTGGVQAQAEAVKRGFGDIGLGTQSAATLGIKNFDDQVRALSPSLRGLSQDLKQNKNALGEGNEVVLRAVERYRQLEEKHKSGGGAARSHALAENALTRELKDAQAALIGDNFAARDQKITNDIAAEREALRIKKQLNTEAIGQLVDLEKARHAKVAQDRAVAEQRFQDDLRQMRIRGIENEYDRERALVEFQAEKKAEALILEFGNSAATQNKILAYREATEEEFARWFVDRTKKLNIELERVGIARMRQSGAEVEKDEEARLKRQAAEFIKHQTEMDNLAKRLTQINVRSGRGQFIDVIQLESDIQVLEKLGLTVHEVDQSFGSASRSADQWHERLQILNGASISLSARLSELVDWQNILTAGIHAFTNAIAGAVAGTENLGRALLVGFLQILSEIAIMLGTLFILAAAGFIALPGFQWSAGQLATAGIALLAFGAVLGGLAQKFGQEPKPQGSAAAGGSSSGGAPGGRESHPGQLIPFPTSGATSITNITVKLDQAGTRDFLKGNKVMMIPDAMSPGTQTAKAIKKAA